MKKLNQLFVLILLLNSICVYAQKASWGPVNQSKKKYRPYIRANNESGIFVSSYQGNKLLIEKYSSNGQKKVMSKIIDPPRAGKYKINVDHIVVIDKDFVIFADYYDKSERKNHVFAFKVDGSTGKIKKKDQELFVEEVDNKRRKGTYRVKLSEDKSKVLINFFAYHKKEGEYIDKYKLLDKNLVTDFEKEYQINREDADHYFTFNYIIDNEGSVYFLASKKDGFYAVTMDVNVDYEKWEEKIDIDNLAPGSSITDLTFLLNKEGHMVVSGFYNKLENKKKRNGKIKKKVHYGGVDGCLFVKINYKTKEVDVAKVSEFSKEFKNQFLTEKDAKKGREASIASNFNKINIELKDNGGLVMVAELYYYFYTTDNNGGLTSEHWYYGDLVAVNFTSDGELKWANRIPKNQVWHWNSIFGIIVGPFFPRPFIAPNSYNYLDYLSFSSSLTEDKLYVVFNDHPVNAEMNASQSEKNIPKKHTKVYKSVQTVYEIDLNTGEKNKSVLKSGNNHKLIMKPRRSHQENQGEDQIIFSQRGNKYSYGVFKP